MLDRLYRVLSWWLRGSQVRKTEFAENGRSRWRAVNATSVGTIGNAYRTWNTDANSYPEESSEGYIQKINKEPEGRKIK